MSRFTIQEFEVPEGDVIQVPWHVGTEVIGNYVKNEAADSGLMDVNAVRKTVSRLVVIAQFDPDAPQVTKTLVKVKCGMVLNLDEGTALRHLCTWYNPLSREHVVLAVMDGEADKRPQEAVAIAKTSP
jgi:hypothetical protein